MKEDSQMTKTFLIIIYILTMQVGVVLGLLSVTSLVGILSGLSVAVGGALNFIQENEKLEHSKPKLLLQNVAPRDPHARPQQR